MEKNRGLKICVRTLQLPYTDGGGITFQLIFVKHFWKPVSHYPSWGGCSFDFTEILFTEIQNHIKRPKKLPVPVFSPQFYTSPPPRGGGFGPKNQSIIFKKHSVDPQPWGGGHKQLSGSKLIKKCAPKYVGIRKIFPIFYRNYDDSQKKSGGNHTRFGDTPDSRTIPDRRVSFQNKMSVTAFRWESKTHPPRSVCNCSDNQGRSGWDIRLPTLSTFGWGAVNFENQSFTPYP